MCVCSAERTQDITCYTGAQQASAEVTVFSCCSCLPSKSMYLLSTTVLDYVVTYSGCQFRGNSSIVKPMPSNEEDTSLTVLSYKKVGLFPPKVGTALMLMA